MPTAFIHLRDAAPYRKENFVAGFQRMGFTVDHRPPQRPLDEKDVAVIWNKNQRSQDWIEAARRGKGALFVVENGYYGKDENGIQPYAIALDGHNGSGRFYVGDDTRLRELNIPFKPWRSPTKDGYILICGQRGIGSKQMRSPPNFENEMALALHTHTKRRIKLRAHPGRHAPTSTLEEDMAGAHLMLVWSSNSATAALIDGLPVMYSAPRISTGGAACKFDLGRIEEPPTPDRKEAFIRMSWQQWFLSEVASGVAIDTLLMVHRGTLPAYSKGLGL